MPPRQREEGLEFRHRRKSTPRGDDGRGEFAGKPVPLRQDAFQIVPPLLLNPSCGGQRADLGEKREPRETVYSDCSETMVSDVRA
jgi:hypothetical protein